MGYIIRNGISYFGDNAVELTQAQYDALPSSKLTDGVDYYITDAQAGTPLATEIAMSTSDNTSVADKITNLSYEDGESGTLATGLWKYRKWVDGTLEVWGHQVTTETVTFNQWGTIYSWDASGITGSAPIAFVSTDFVSGSLFIGGLNGIGTLRTDQVGYIFIRGAVASSASYPITRYMYKRGRWKA